MYKVLAFPEGHTVHNVENKIEAIALADELARDYLAAFVLDEDDENIYQVERAWEFPWEM